MEEKVGEKVSDTPILEKDSEKGCRKQNKSCFRKKNSNSKKNQIDFREQIDRLSMLATHNFQITFITQKMAVLPRYGLGVVGAVR